LLAFDPRLYFFEFVEMLDCLHVQVRRYHFLVFEISLDCTKVYALGNLGQLGALDIAGDAVTKVKGQVYFLGLYLFGHRASGDGLWTKGFITLTHLVPFCYLICLLIFEKLVYFSFHWVRFHVHFLR
jgi:hypothetical protein